MVEPQTPGVPDHAKTVQTVGWSPKALWGAVAALLAPFALAAVTALVEMLASQPELFDGLPAIVQWIITAVVTGAATLLAAYKAEPGTVVEKRQS